MIAYEVIDTEERLTIATFKHAATAHIVAADLNAQWCTEERYQVVRRISVERGVDYEHDPHFYDLAPLDAIYSVH